MRTEFEGLSEVREIRRAFAGAGVVKIAGFLSADIAARLAQLVDGAYRVARSELDAGSDVDPVLAENLLGWNGLVQEQLAPLLSRAAPTLEIERAAIAAAIGAEVQRLFGPRWLAVPSRSFFRRLEPGRNGEAGVAWHIDADAARMDGFGDDSLNVWLPLVPVGGDAPSLEFVPGSHRLMRGLPLLPDAYRNRSDDWVRAHDGGLRWIPQASPGDALIFGQHTLHRTQVGALAGRTSCEFRFLRQRTLWTRLKRRAQRLAR